MKLSEKAIKDLRLELRKKYGDQVDKNLSDQDIEKLGLLVLNILARQIKSSLS